MTMQIIGISILTIGMAVLSSGAGLYWSIDEGKRTSGKAKGIAVGLAIFGLFLALVGIGISADSGKKIHDSEKRPIPITANK